MKLHSNQQRSKDWNTPKTEMTTVEKKNYHA